MECMECNLNRVSTWDISCSCRVERVLFVLHLKSVKSEIVARSFCSSLISLKRGARALFLLGAGFYTYKIILLYHNCDMVTCLPMCLHALSEAFNFSSCVCAEFHTSCQPVRRFGLLMKYRHCFATVIPLNHFVHHEISQL